MSRFAIRKNQSDDAGDCAVGATPGEVIVMPLYLTTMTGEEEEEVVVATLCHSKFGHMRDKRYHHNRYMLHS